jgi:hypothetical protein
VMNPKPFWVLKNLTVPVAMMAFLAFDATEVEIRAKRFPSRAIETSEF